MEAVDQFRAVGAEHHQIGEGLGCVAGDEGLHGEFRIPAPVDVNVDDLCVGVDGLTCRPTPPATAVAFESQVLDIHSPAGRTRVGGSGG